MTVLDFGCGLGHYSLGMARLTGSRGRVIAADVQQKMLNKVISRAQKARMNDIITPYLCNGNGLNVSAEFDFALASNSLHETPDPSETLRQIFQRLKPGGYFLLMEPPGHLTPEDFDHEIKLAEQSGFKKECNPAIRRSMSMLFSKP
jgi:ubiquinone/menaquinone biosynthesis C-methylase UbiE